MAKQVGPCGKEIQTPKVEIRLVYTSEGPRIEIAMLSDEYCWRVRSWWTLESAKNIADDIYESIKSDSENG
jgi:hypothetical protein